VKNVDAIKERKKGESPKNAVDAPVLIPGGIFRKPEFSLGPETYR
ncbi:3268_t:CDS:1, partial [Acaulospora colombiana]